MQDVITLHQGSPNYGFTGQMRPVKPFHLARKAVFAMVKKYNYEKLLIW